MNVYIWVKWLRGCESADRGAGGQGGAGGGVREALVGHSGVLPGDIQPSQV